MKKPSLLLLDADAVIHCYELGIWEVLKGKYSVHVTSIVTDEVQWANAPGGRCTVDLEAQAASGQITVVEATASEMAYVANFFADAFAQGLDDGETEGLAVLLRGDLENCAFCTGDTNGLEALGMLGLAGKALSLETIFDQGGIRVASPLRLMPNFQTRSVELHIGKGRARRISGECFRSESARLAALAH